MMPSYHTIEVLTLLTFLGTVFGKPVNSTFQFEELSPDSEWVWRSGAGNLKTLRISKPGRNVLVLDLCPRARNPKKPVIAKVDNIRYSNDGASDVVRMAVNSRFIGLFATDGVSNYGFNWNVFYDTGRIGRAFKMASGSRPKLRFVVRTDNYGLELDEIDIKARNQRADADLFCR